MQILIELSLLYLDVRAIHTWRLVLSRRRHLFFRIRLCRHGRLHVVLRQDGRLERAVLHHLTLDEHEPLSLPILVELRAVLKVVRLVDLHILYDTSFTH